MRTHGASKTSEYAIWWQMWYRCINPKHVKFADYGGRGIKVDPIWEKFEQFIADMGPRPSMQHTLDRIDNNLGYSKGNCQWATGKQQYANRRPKEPTYRGIPVSKLGITEIPS
jgi:hypothetical protein